MHETRTTSAPRRWAWLLALVFAVSLCCQPVWATSRERTVIPLGKAVGIKLFADGVLVVGLAEGSDCPARRCGLKTGDIITAINGTHITSTEQVQQLLQEGGETVTLSVHRDGKALTCTAHMDDEDTRQLGAWIRDSMAGIGTLTYYDPATGQYGALGHGITDVDTAQLMPLQSGSIMETTVKAVKKGVKGEAGELKGDFSRQRDVGSVTVNSDGGIFGTVADVAYLGGGKPVPVAAPHQVKTGSATILSTVAGGETEEYTVDILRVYGDGAATRNLLLRVTDQRLLDITGGIVQGMSGSPILQNGRIVGAVTHVCVNL